MTKVYLVTDGWYSDYRVLGVYSTKARADKARELFNAGNDVDPIEIDATPERPRGMLKWVVMMDRNGNTEDVKRESCEVDRTQVRVYLPWKAEVVLMSAHIWAKDEAHAVKIANEWRTRIIANNLWVDGKYLDPSKDF